MKKRIAVLLALALAAAAAPAQILRLDLDGMIERTDNAVFAEIVDRHVFRVDDPIDGPELYYTTLTLRGRSLMDDTQMTVRVTYPGGFISETEGVWNSEAPTMDDTRVGNRVVAFYKWSDNLGGRVAANALYTSHGGIYRTVESADQTVVMGRGNGYAIENNVKLTDLRSAIAHIQIAQKEAK